MVSSGCSGGSGGSGGVGADALDELAALFVFLADRDFHGYSPIYERLARSIAEDRTLLAFIDAAVSPNVRRGRVPVLFLAATHDVALGEPDSELASIYRGERDGDPHAAVVALVGRHREAVEANLRHRSVQTNEVGRSAAIAPAILRTTSLLAAAGARRPVALVEVGPSAGLNLFVDRYRITYRRHASATAATGPEDAEVQLACDLRGDRLPPVAPSLPDIVVRTGVDPAPVDVSDPVQRRWLRACLWPGQSAREALLDAAMALAAVDPPTVARGDAVTDLAPLVQALPDEVQPIVVSTWALAYVTEEGRRTMLASLDEVGATRDLALVTLEEPRFTPWIPAVDEATGERDGTRTVLGRRSWASGAVYNEALALSHPHGRWMHWLV
jgi:hypothetical protein